MILHHQPEPVTVAGERAFDLSWLVGAIPEWTQDAMCAQVDPELFFPTTGASSEPAKTICATCPVVEECLEYAESFEAGEQGTQTSYGPFGVYGGRSANERRKAMRERRGSAA